MADTGLLDQDSSESVPRIGAISFRSYRGPVGEPLTDWCYDPEAVPVQAEY